MDESTKKEKYTGGEVQIRHVCSWQKDYPLNTERKRVKGLGRRSKTRYPETWDPQSPLSTLVVKGLPLNSAVTVMWRADGSMANFLWVPKNRGRIGQVQTALHSWWKENVAKPISNIDGFRETRLQRTQSGS